MQTGLVQPYGLEYLLTSMIPPSPSSDASGFGRRRQNRAETGRARGRKTRDELLTTWEYDTK